MNSKLQNKLVDKYPKIFLDDKRSKILCWGIECPDSWYHILEALCFRIQQAVDNPPTQIKKTIIGFLFGWIFKLLGIERKYFLVLNKIVQKKIPQIKAVQVKEKFGLLRFYTNYSNDEINNIIYFAELLTSKICYNCASFKNVKMVHGGWVIYLCQDCRKKKH